MPAAGLWRSFSPRARPVTPRFHRCHDPPACSSSARTAPHQAGPGPGRQGVLLPSDPRAPAHARHPCSDPRPRRPARTPATPGQPRWRATGLRPRDLRTAQHRRAVHQPLEAVAVHRHPICEDRHHLPCRTPHRGHPPLVRPVPRTTLPGGGLGARLWCADRPPVWTTKNPRVIDLGVSRGAGDENRTRTLSLGSLGSLAAVAALTCGGMVWESWSDPGRVPPVPRGSPQDLAREWHRPFDSYAPWRSCAGSV